MIKTTLKIDGMMCGMCESHINDTVRNHFKIKKVTSSHSKGTVYENVELVSQISKEAPKSACYIFNT